MSKPPDAWKDIQNYNFHRSGLCAAGNNSTNGDDNDATTTSFVLKGTGTMNADGKFIDDISFPCKTLRAHMNDLGHGRVDILKADVEGMEWSLTRDWGMVAAATTTDSTTNADAGTTGSQTQTQTTTVGTVLPLSSMVGQLLMEFHFWHDEAPNDLSTLLRKHIIPLERMGFFLQTTEPVGATIDAYEVTFLNVNWRPDYYDDHNNDAIGDDNGRRGRIRGRGRRSTTMNKLPLLFDPSMYPQTPNVVL
eukprot:CAMPEP_0198269244 /NCGR_PEP_ID=MMETSP1447-20131203/40634_1 /TAXON_ID=420782 /ORGANISM="Chaetoceros dichaeta, Strain CCMP1751" /LENGTH=248 /DNA_ID=CAMNT_0043960763 /DNA_START=177 /DNA_END=923 /DNA_ORIENTATION=+